MHKPKSEAKAARPCKPSRALTVQVTIPPAAVPLLTALAALDSTTLEATASRVFLLGLRSDEVGAEFTEAVNGFLAKTGADAR